MDKWSALAVARHTQGYTDQNQVAAAFFNNVGSYAILDVAFGYRPIKGLQLGVGIQNVFNTDPPFSNQVGRFQARAYDDRFASPLGRTYSLSAKYEF
jgi:iron complex outermembrane receptor protein